MAVDIERAKAHLGIDWDLAPEQLALVTAYLSASIAAVEKQAQTLLTEREVRQRIDRFVDRRGCSTIRLHWGPVVSVEGIDYLDAYGVAATLDIGAGDFRLVEGVPALLLPPVDGSWPTAIEEPGSVTIRYTAGYGGSGLNAAGDSPGDLDAAVLMMVGHLYHNRETVVTGTIATEMPMGVAALCFPYRHTLL